MVGVVGRGRITGGGAASVRATGTATGSRASSAARVVETLPAMGFSRISIATAVGRVSGAVVARLAWSGCVFVHLTIPKASTTRTQIAPTATPTLSAVLLLGVAVYPYL